MSETIILTEKVPAVIDSKAAPILLGDDLIASVHKINKPEKRANSLGNFSHLGQRNAFHISWRRILW